MEKTKVWYSPTNGGDGSVFLRWFLTEKEAREDQDNQDEGWGEDCSGSVETFIGSDIHKEATKRYDD
jgi:hypothetical protein